MLSNIAEIMSQQYDMKKLEVVARDISCKTTLSLAGTTGMLCSILEKGIDVPLILTLYQVIGIEIVQVPVLARNMNTYETEELIRGIIKDGHIKETTELQGILYR